MFVAARSAERSPPAPADRVENLINQRRSDEAFRLLDVLVARIVAEPNSSRYQLDLASLDGILQAVWCRDELSGFLPAASEIETPSIAVGVFAPVNAERYQKAQNALFVLLDELTRPGCDGSATLKIRGLGGELADDIRAESHRRWQF
jgi:hypothetical protein